MDKLKQFFADCDMLFHPKTAAHIKSMTAAIVKAKEAWTADEVKKRYSQFVTNPEVAHEICAARLIKISNDVLAHTFALSFLELVSLGDSEWPVIVNRHIDKNFKITKLGQNGGAPKKQLVERQTTLQLLMERISTEEYEFPLYNLQVGSTDELNECSARQVYEMTLKLDVLARAILDATAIASGLRATLNLHPSIIAANIPDANYLDLSTIGTSGQWNVEKIKRILDYCARFSADTSDDLGDTTVKAIYLPSTQKRDFWDMCELVSAYSGYAGAAPTGVVSDPNQTIPHEARMEIWRSGKLESMFGYSFAIVTRNTIAAPYSYVSTNRPMGYFFQKPSQDSYHLDNSSKMIKANKNSIWSAKTIQMAAMSEWTKNFLRVKV